MKASGELASVPKPDVKTFVVCFCFFALYLIGLPEQVKPSPV